MQSMDKFSKYSKMLLKLKKKKKQEKLFKLNDNEIQYVVQTHQIRLFSFRVQNVTKIKSSKRTHHRLI